MIWLFLAVLALLVVAMAVVAWRTPKNVIPVDVDRTWQTIGAFYRNRPDRTAEVDLGNEWTSEVDPGAAFELSWIKETRELVALRRQAKAQLLAGGGIISAVPATFGADRRTGMKVLAVADLQELHRLRPHRLERLPDGLDQFTAQLGAPYQPPDPARPSDPPARRIGRGSPNGSTSGSYRLWLGASTHAWRARARARADRR